MTTMTPNHRTPADAGITFLFHVEHHWPRAAECGRSPYATESPFARDPAADHSPPAGFVPAGMPAVFPGRGCGLSQAHNHRSRVLAVGGARRMQKCTKS